MKNGGVSQDTPLTFVPSSTSVKKDAAMKLTEYTPQFENDVKDLLVELQAHLASLDPYHIIVLRDNYRNDYFAHAMAAVKKHAGKIFLALEKEKAVGVAICMIPPYGEESRLTTTCPKCGFISDLVVTASMRGKGIGSALLAQAEQYFTEQNCTLMQFCVSAYNQRALRLYERFGMEMDCYYLKKPLQRRI